MRKRPRRKNLKAPEPIDELIERAGEQRYAKKKAPIPVAEWRLAMGPRIADRARPLSLERGILFVLVATSVWANELSMLSKDLVERLKSRGFAVTGIRFKVGSMDPVDRPPERRAMRRVPPPKPLPATLREEVSKVGDQELRSILAQTASAALAWQEFNGVNVGAPASRGPRDAGRGNAPPGRSAGASDEASPRSSGGERDRRR